MSLNFTADGQKLVNSTAGSFTPAGCTEITVGIWVKRVSGTSTGQGYFTASGTLSDAAVSAVAAHNGGVADCWVSPGGSSRRLDGVGNANSTAWQLLVLTYKQGVENRAYTAITGGSVASGTAGGSVSTEVLGALQAVQLGVPPFATVNNWHPRAKVAHAFVCKRALNSTEVTALFNGGTAGAGANPTAVCGADLTFYAPLLSDATVQTGGVTLTATGSPTFDGADNPVVDAPPSAPAPVLSSPTAGTPGATSITITATSDRASDGTVYFLRRVGGSAASAATIVSTGESQAASTNPQSRLMTGFTASSANNFVDVVQAGAGGNSNVVSAGPFTMASADPTPPSWGGATLSATSVTTTSFTVTASAAATDNVAVTGYETSFDGGSTYTTNSPATSLSRAYSGGTPGATVEVRMRAFDAAGNRSTALSLSQALNNTSITLGPFASNGTVWPSGTAVHVSWLPAGRIGSLAAVTAVDRTATLATGGTVAITGLPAGAGIAMVAKRVTSATDDEVCYQAGTVA